MNWMITIQLSSNNKINYRVNASEKTLFYKKLSFDDDESFSIQADGEIYTIFKRHITCVLEVPLKEQE